MHNTKKSKFQCTCMTDTSHAHDPHDISEQEIWLWPLHISEQEVPEVVFTKKVMGTTGDHQVIPFQTCSVNLLAIGSSYINQFNHGSYCYDAISILTCSYP